ncbi:MAG: AAA family ATPase, partial [Woeseia sp.]
MYTSFFGLNEKPFAITPDPRYLFMSERHGEGLAHLVYGVTESGGFIQLTGEVGTGKTTLVRSLLGQLPDEVDVALILNPQISAIEFLL